MCGLNGVFGEIGWRDQTALGILSTFSQLRGRHSTGLGIVYTKKKIPPRVLKAVGGQEALARAYEKDFEPTSWQSRIVGARCLVGHSRFATVGWVSKENAHPFLEKHILGCHNGTIPNHFLKSLGQYSRALSDSQVLLREIASGCEVATVLEKICGAWALVWFDTKARRLNMARNKERTLFIARANAGKTVYWASEAWMLSLALSRVDIPFDPPEAVIADKHLVWVMEADGKVAVERVSHTPGRSPATYQKVTPTATVTPLFPKIRAAMEKIARGLPGSRVDDDEYEEEYVQVGDLGWIHRRVYKKLTEAGCYNCAAPLLWAVRDNLLWTSGNIPYCADCADFLTSEKGRH